MWADWSELRLHRDDAWFSPRVCNGSNPRGPNEHRNQRHRGFGAAGFPFAEPFHAGELANGDSAVLFRGLAGGFLADREHFSRFQRDRDRRTSPGREFRHDP